MHPFRTALLAVAVLSLASCAVSPTVREHVAPGSEIAVVIFRDCTIPGQEDCSGSGVSAGSVFARVLSATNAMRAVPLARPVPASALLDDSAAAAYAKQKGFRYVVTGEVQDYYRVAPTRLSTIC